MSEANHVVGPMVEIYPRNVYCMIYNLHYSDRRND